VKIIGFIFARGGSKGVPGKNIKLFNGKPLIAWSIQQALEVKAFDRVIVSTDSKEIAKVAAEYGAEVPFLRPKELAQDNSPEWLSWQHAINYIQASTKELPDLIVSIPATSPLRLSDDIQRCIDEYLIGDVDIVITATEAQRNPYFNMIRRNAKNFVDVVMHPESAIYRRQDAPELFDMATIAYVANPKFILNNSSLFQGKVRAVIIPRERSIDIDTPLDFDVAEFLFRRRMKNAT